jgi:hypothetical protein
LQPQKFFLVVRQRSFTRISESSACEDVEDRCTNDPARIIVLLHRLGRFLYSSAALINR